MRLSKELLDQVKNQAASAGITHSDFIRRALEMAVAFDAETLDRLTLFTRKMGVREGNAVCNIVAAFIAKYDASVATKQPFDSSILYEPIEPVTGGDPFSTDGPPLVYGSLAYDKAFMEAHADYLAKSKNAK